VLLASWWFSVGNALADSYPPALGCAVAASAPAGAGVFAVRGMGFRAGSQVLVTVAGQRAGSAVADRAGSFEASWLVARLAPRMTVTAADASCAVTSLLLIENRQPSQDEISPPLAPGGGPSSRQPNPAAPVKPSQPRPAPGAASPGARPEPVPPAPRREPAAVAIPSIPLTGLPPQLFLGVAGALLLAGAALTGLTGRLGHRSERRPTAASSVSSTLPAASGPI
jgi:hypothetical protein